MINNIIGQDELIPEIEAYIEELKTGRNLNILLTGRSGLGKTHIVTVIANVLGVENFILHLDSASEVDKNKRFQVFDECHLLKEPEILYPYMDKKKYSFFFMTNYPGKVNEPLRNRCFILRLRPYTVEDIAIIIYREINITPEAALYLAKFCKGSPREAKSLAQRVSILTRDKVKDISYLNQILYTLGIRSSGLNTDDIIYLNALERAGGTASIKLLSAMTGFDINYLNELEAYLIEAGKIQITGRGRELC